MKIHRKTIAPPRIEMLPLIDIVFLLLVFFIYAMLSMAVHHGQPVDLPQSSSATPEPEEAISITIQDMGQGINLFVDEEPVSLELLTERLQDKKAAMPVEEVQIFADRVFNYLEMILPRIYTHLNI